MLREYIGQAGHLSVIISFVSAIVAALGYFMATKHEDNNIEEANSWKRFARIAFAVHGVAVISIIVTLFTIIYKNYFEFHYAWEHASKSLPAYYMISCFWEGQEGSFLLWIFWHVVLGVILIKTNKVWEAPMMTVFALVQAFLTSMILGVVIFGDLKLGSTPFILMREFMIDAPVFKMNPNYVPEDGTGLNPLLQNYWMVIHPPTLFLGFAATLVPFSFCIAGLWKNRFTEWVRPALPWTLFASFILGLGILMGAYWAYETLNFGGYWNWDPVENAVYVPWLVLVGSLHTMLIYKSNETALRTTVVLTITTFLLILYSTFLTRSGILGNASVHSFTDLGMSGQLLVYLLFFTIIAKILVIVKWKKIPTTEKEESIYSREFWVFIGAVVLCLAGFQVLLATSIPVYNAVAKWLNLASNFAPPAEPALFYSNWQLYFMAVIAILSGVGQYFYWKKIDNKNFFDALYLPSLVAVVLATALVVITKVDKLPYMLLVLTSTFTVVSNLFILKDLVSKNYKIAGGSVSHIGLGLMLIGILYSSGYSKIVSLNLKGLNYSNEFTKEMNLENILLFRNTPEKMGDYLVKYKGPRIEGEKGKDGFIDKSLVFNSPDPQKVIAKFDIPNSSYKKGDTIKTAPENTYYEIEYVNGKDTFSLYPRTQNNPQMGFMASPDIKRKFKSDLYTHISSVPDNEKERSWSDMEEFKVALGDTFFLNDYVAILKSVKAVKTVEEIVLTEKDAAIQAEIEVLARNDKGSYTVYPHFVIKDNMVGRLPEIIEDLGIKVTLLSVDPQKNIFTLGVNTTQKDWVILKAMEKPYVNVLWIGSLLVLIGFWMAMVRRYKEFRLMRDKGQEIRL